MKTTIGVLDAGDTGDVPNSGTPIGTVTVEDGEVSYSGEILTDDERDLLSGLSDGYDMTGGGVREPEIPGEPLTAVEGAEDLSHEETVNVAVRAVEALGYRAVSG